MWKSTIRKAALPLKPSSTSKCSFPLLVRSTVMATFIGKFSTIRLRAVLYAHFAATDVSANHKTCVQRRVVRRTPGQHLIIARGQVPSVLLFIKGLQHPVIDRNRNGLRFARSKRDSLPPDKPLEGFVCTFRKPPIDLSNLGAGSLAGVFDSEAG